MGAVYLVQDKQTGKLVALKMLHDKYANSKHAIARFIREVNTSRRLNHPGIVKVYEASKWNNTLFYTMEYIEGRSLRRWLQARHRLEFNSVVRVLCLVADALTHAHQITIHRDLSPENIMVLPNGSIRLLDFGLAKLDDQFKGLTVVGANLGKIHYMAPEQQLNPAGVDYRADIFSLGVMFYELLCGRSPQSGYKITEIRPELPPECNAFVEKATHPDPNLRYQSAQEFRQALLSLYHISEARRQRTVQKPASFMDKVKAFFQNLLPQRGKARQPQKRRRR
jgi:serine/threonine-protein kinase